MQVRACCVSSLFALFMPLSGPFRRLPNAYAAASRKSANALGLFFFSEFRTQFYMQTVTAHAKKGKLEMIYDGCNRCLVLPTMGVDV